MTNRPAGPVGMAMAAVVFYVIYRGLIALDAWEPLIWLYTLLIAYCLLSIVRGLWTEFQWLRLLRAMKTASGIFGRTDNPTASDAETFGLKFSNPDGNGIPLGGVGNKIIYYDGPAPISIRAATNAGKTESSSASICFALGAHRNIIATAKGAELAYLAGPCRHDVLKQNVIFIDPWREMRKFGLPSHDFNPVGHFPDYVGKPELIDKAKATVLTLMPESANASGENKIFRVTARDVSAWLLIKLAINQAETGELCCNLPYLHGLIGGSNADLQNFLSEMIACDLHNGSVRRAAERVRAMIERNPKFAEVVLKEALTALEPYDPAGPLGETTNYSNFNPRDLKTPGKPTSIFIVVPAEKALLYGQNTGLCINALIDICIEANRFEPRVSIIADEFASYGVLPSALPALYLGRSRGVQLITYVQDTQSYERYGKEASAFTTQSEVVVAFSIRSTKDAKEYSERSGQRSIVTESIGVPQQSGATPGYSTTLSERGIPHYRPDEFLHLADFTAAVFFKQNPPIIVDLVSYRAVDGWYQHAKPMPGAPPLKDIPVKYKA
ncbi:hypothetical protein DWF00_07630 [Bosea caraganae]|uniref:Type IV secretory system conjugative DNA transfer family protein n=1 Tax=Bosea caraganae TaxID=2763117 RepID=A0A370L118_9HYPH|nr:type IV secretory system conjugative DNA transfer family protein [Bosea caraganae]RDJ21081.1 hypothetical protein DWE98_22425 [Bosea caraganae]RDJ28580.1 hypothetical protein DWF00_07630 [Bosea caraganae]